MGEEAHTDLLDVLHRIREFVCVSPHAGMYGDPDRALKALDQHIANIQAGNAVEWDELNILFAPTGEFQEVSLDNG